MNDFTKDELLELLYSLDCCHITPVGVKSPPLILKIQSMMDSYCEHEWHTYPKNVTAIPFCKKCGAIE